jgi:hypothetical protein
MLKMLFWYISVAWSYSRLTATYYSERSHVYDQQYMATLPKSCNGDKSGDESDVDHSAYSYLLVTASNHIKDRLTKPMKIE